MRVTTGASAAAPSAGLAGDGRALGGRRRVGLEEVEEMIEGHVGEAAAKQHGEDAVFADGIVERGDEVLGRQRALVEELFHQLVFAFGDELDESFVAGLGVGSERGGNFSGDFAAAVAAGSVGVGLHGDEIDDAVKALRVGDGQLDGNTVAAPAVLQIVDERAQAAFAAGLGVVHLIDEDDAGNAGLFGVAPHALGDGLDAALGVDDDDGGFDGEERGAGFVGEHVEAGRVDEIDLRALPLGKGDGVLHGDAAGYFFFVVGGHGRAVFHAALRGRHLGGMQQSGDEGGFAAVRMPHYSYVADLTSLVRFHGILLRFWASLRGFRRTWALEEARGRDFAATPAGALKWPNCRAPVRFCRLPHPCGMVSGRRRAQRTE